MRILSIILCGLALAADGRAGLTIKMQLEGSDMPGGQAMPATMKFGGGNMRMDFAEGSMIVRAAENQAWMLAHADKMAMQMNTGAAQASTTGSVQQPEFTRTGRKETISGLECEEWTSKTESGGVVEFWFSSDGPPMSEVGPAFFRLADLSSSMKMNWSSWLGGNKAFRTFPMRVVSRGDQGGSSRTTVLSFSKEAISATEFEVPADYKQMQMPSWGNPAPGMAPGSRPGGAKDINKLQEQLQSGQMPSEAQLKEMERMAREMQQQSGR